MAHWPRENVHAASAWRLEIGHDGITRLYKGLTEWMADDPTRRSYMAYYAAHAHGRVLLGGLGLGILLGYCEASPRVSEVTVVEIDPNLPSFLGITGVVCDDFWAYAARHGGFDTIIADLWPDHAQPTEDIAERVARIRKRSPRATLIVHGYPQQSDI